MSVSFPKVNVATYSLSIAVARPASLVIRPRQDHEKAVGELVQRPGMAHASRSQHSFDVGESLERSMSRWLVEKEDAFRQLMTSRSFFAMRKPFSIESSTTKVRCGKIRRDMRLESTVWMKPAA